MTQIANVELPPIYDASRADNAILDMVKKRIRAGIMPPRWHIPYLDNTAHPLYPTWSYLVCGRSGSMKSTLMSHLVRKWSQMLHEENKDRALKRVIVYVKPEENIEMARYQTWDTQPFSLQELVGGKPGAKAVSEAIAKQSTPPVLFIGDSESDEYVPKVKRRRPVRFSTQDITNACDALRDGLFFVQMESALLVIAGR